MHHVTKQYRWLRFVFVNFRPHLPGLATVHATEFAADA